MGKIASASTVYATAYLTEVGRKYLFNKGNVRFDSEGNDLLEIKYFALSDSDTNYNTINRLASGDVPDISGKNDNCIKATADYTQKNLLLQTVEVITNSIDPLYLVGGEESFSLQLSTVPGSSDFPINQPTDTPPIEILQGGNEIKVQ